MSVGWGRWQARCWRRRLGACGGVVGASADAPGGVEPLRRSRRSACAAWVAALATRELELSPCAAPLVSGGSSAAAVARRFRLAALGAGGELREFERARATALDARSAGAARAASRRGASAGERTRIAGQGELVRERAWPRGGAVCADERRRRAAASRAARAGIC